MCLAIPRNCDSSINKNKDLNRTKSIYSAICIRKKD